MAKLKENTLLKIVALILTVLMSSLGTLSLFGGLYDDIKEARWDAVCLYYLAVIALCCFFVFEYISYSVTKEAIKEGIIEEAELVLIPIEE